MTKATNTRTSTKNTLTRDNARKLREEKAAALAAGGIVNPDTLAKSDDYVEASQEAHDFVDTPTENAADAPKEPSTEAKPTGTFVLPESAKLLLDKACDNVAKSTGAGLDMDARLRIKLTGQLIDVAKYNVALAATAIMQSPEKEDLEGRDGRGARVFSLCAAVMKAATFVANLDYRRALGDNDRSNEDEHDPNGTVISPDGKTRFAADQRENERTAPVGLGPDEMSDDERLDKAMQILQDLTDVNIYLTIIVASCDWPIEERPLAFAWEQRPDASFEPVMSAERALDLIEVRRIESLKKRNERNARALTSASTRALELLAAMVKVA